MSERRSKQTRRPPAAARVVRRGAEQTALRHDDIVAWTLRYDGRCSAAMAWSPPLLQTIGCYLSAICIFGDRVRTHLHAPDVRSVGAHSTIWRHIDMRDSPLPLQQAGGAPAAAAVAAITQLPCSGGGGRAIVHRMRSLPSSLLSLLMLLLVAPRRAIIIARPSHSHRSGLPPVHSCRAVNTIKPPWPVALSAPPVRAALTGRYPAAGARSIACEKVPLQHWRPVGRRAGQAVRRSRRRVCGFTLLARVGRSPRPETLIGSCREQGLWLCTGKPRRGETSAAT